MSILTLETKKYAIKIENFEGPLDLLCHLIEKNKMNIYDIHLNEITDQYIQYLNEMEKMNLEIASEFVVMASTLLYLKSKSLLPKQEEEEEELTEEEFEANKELIENEIDRKRAKHAVYENQRTLKAVKALEENNLELFGQLMVGSHVSLRDDYEVTGIELDTLVSLALKQEGVIGARMTGAGFGGCTVSIVRNENVGDFIENVTKGYEEVIGYAPTFYVANISKKTKKIG